MRRMFAWIIAFLLAIACSACGGGSKAAQQMSGAEHQRSQPQIELGGVRIALESYPYQNNMPRVVDANAQARCENFIVVATLRSSEALPHALDMRAVTLSVDGRDVWAGTLVIEQRAQPGARELEAVARGCANARTAAGQNVRVHVEVRHGGRSHWIHHDARIERVS